MLSNCLLILNWTDRLLYFYLMHYGFDLVKLSVHYCISRLSLAQRKKRTANPGDNSITDSRDSSFLVEGVFAVVIADNMCRVSGHDKDCRPWRSPSVNHRDELFQLWYRRFPSICRFRCAFWRLRSVALLLNSHSFSMYWLILIFRQHVVWEITPILYIYIIYYFIVLWYYFIIVLSSWLFFFYYIEI